MKNARSSSPRHVPTEHGATRTGLVIAVHGSHNGSAANGSVRARADAVAELGRFDEVSAAFHSGTPRFSEVLDRMRAEDMIVVPLMTSEGFYCDTVLPRELATNARFPTIRVRRTLPVGTHPALPEVASRRVRRLLDRYERAATDTSLIIVGHGTERHRSSRLAAFEFAAALGRRGGWAGALVAFLDEQPLVEEVFRRTRSRCVLVVPFLIGGGQHATVDIPTRLGMAPSSDATGPRVGQVGSRLVICDISVGAYPEITDIIVDLAESTNGPPAHVGICEVTS